MLFVGISVSDDILDCFKKERESLSGDQRERESKKGRERVRERERVKKYRVQV